MSLKVISINELKPGMFVSKVLEQTGNMRIVTKGLVRTHSIIERLKSRGVTRLEIDLTKESGDQQKNQQQTEQVVKEARKQVPISTKSELAKAKQILVKAKRIQREMFATFENKGTPDLAAVEKVAEEIIASVNRNQDAMILLTAIRDKGHYLLEHCISVSVMVCIVAKALGYSDELTKQLALGCLLHDVGKIHVDNKILTKPTKLQKNEFKYLVQSVVVGHQMISGLVGINTSTKDMVLCHKEHLDGTGYPRGIEGNEISEQARVLSVIDAYDALTHDRPYASAMPPQQAFQILFNEQQNFDQGIVQILVDAIGIYPVGSLVKLSNGKLAVIQKTNRFDADKPKVTEFYHFREKYFVSLKDIDLAEPGCQITMVSAVSADDYGLDVSKFYNDLLINHFSH